MLLVLHLLWPGASAHATVGLAEYTWYFHDQPGQWIEWHHGDICPSAATRKDCILVRKAGDGQQQPRGAEPWPYNDAPQGLYLATALALLPLALTVIGGLRLWRAWQQGRLKDRGSRSRANWTVAVITAVGLAGVPYGLAVLIPTSPEASGWGVVIVLWINVLIVLAPLALWWAFRRLFSASGRVTTRGWRRLLLWHILLLSSVLAPLLLGGPPNLVLLLFPPMLLLNILASLLAVWAVSTTADAVARRDAKG